MMGVHHHRPGAILILPINNSRVLSHELGETLNRLEAGYGRKRQWLWTVVGRGR